MTKSKKPSNLEGDPPQSGTTADSIFELLDYTQLAKITKKSIVTLRRYKMLGTGPRPLVIGREVRFMRRDVLTWLESLAVAENRKGFVDRCL